MKGEGDRLLRRLGIVALTVGLLGTVGTAPPLSGDEPFEPGSVVARADSLRAGGFTGGTEFAVTLGTALTRAQGTQGNAASQAIDLGIFGLIASSESACTGEPLLLEPDQVPRPLRTNSVGGPDSQDREFLFDGGILRGGREYVQVDPSPYALSTTEVAELILDPLISLDGLHSQSEATIDAAQELRRGEASASVGAIDLADGLVRLEGLHWELATSTGADTSEDASFTVGRMMLFGVLPLGVETPDQLNESLNTVNSLLAPLGLSIVAPVVDHRENTTEISSLLIRVGGAEDSATLLGPLLTAVQPLRDALFDLANVLECPLDRGAVDGLMTVADILIAAVVGAGGVTIELGGARTTHDTAVFGNRFGDVSPSTLEPVVTEDVTAIEKIPSTSRREASEEGAGGDLVTQSEPRSVSCQTTHPSGNPGCWEGLAALAGGISLVVALGLLGTDAYLTRRRKQVA